MQIHSFSLHWHRLPFLANMASQWFIWWIGLCLWTYEAYTATRTSSHTLRKPLRLNGNFRKADPVRSYEFHLSQLVAQPKYQRYLCLRESSFFAFSCWIWWYLSLSLTNSSPQIWQRDIGLWCFNFAWVTKSEYWWNFWPQRSHICFLGFNNFPNIILGTYGK